MTFSIPHAADRHRACCDVRVHDMYIMHRDAMQYTCCYYALVHAYADLHDIVHVQMWAM